jgi:hypothetical protein
MSDFAAVGYRTEAVGITPAAMNTLMGAVPLPVVTIAELGLRVSADATVTALQTITRTVQYAFGPSGVTDAVANIQNDGTIISITPGNRGNDYIRPPFVTLTPAVQTPAQLRAFLRVNATAVDTAGAGYVGTVLVSYIGGLPPAGRRIISGCVNTIYVTNPGLGYPVGTTISIDGGGNNGPPTVQATATITRDAFGRLSAPVLTNMGAGYVSIPKVSIHCPGGVQPSKAAKIFVSMAEGTPAQAGAVVLGGGGSIVSIATASPGGGYVGVPTVLIRGTGTGAVARARMELDRVDTLFAGKGYPGAGGTVVVFTPFFKQQFPNTSDQAAPFNKIFQALFVTRAVTPILVLAPVLT